MWVQLSKLDRESNVVSILLKYVLRPLHKLLVLKWGPWGPYGNIEQIQNRSEARCLKCVKGLIKKFEDWNHRKHMDDSDQGIYWLWHHMHNKALFKQNQTRPVHFCHFACKFQCVFDNKVEYQNYILQRWNSSRGLIHFQGETTQTTLFLLLLKMDQLEKERELILSF